MSLERLPTELVHEIFGLQDIHSVHKYRRINKRLNACLSDRDFVIVLAQKSVNSVALHLQAKRTISHSIPQVLKNILRWPDAQQTAAASIFLRGVVSVNWQITPNPTKEVTTGGEFPLSLLAGIPDLVDLTLYGGPVSSHIPTAISGLRKLKKLNLGFLGISGEIPADAFVQLRYLQVLKLHSNKLFGFVPAAIGSIFTLTTLNLASNNLDGNIPTELGNLVALEVLQLDENNLTGVIPVSILGLRNLKDFRLSSNNLEGSIPTEIEGLESAEKIFLQYNKFTGEIPGVFSKLKKLNTLLLQNNSLTGEIPDVIYDSKTLNQLFLNNNKLTGRISEKVSNCINLKQFDVACNKLTGKLPVQLGKLKLEYFNVNRNDMEEILDMEMNWESEVYQSLTALGWTVATEKKVLKE
ncbi:hypothetical protein HK100_012306 [Physocladia obscura]|uniref:F-box domain-containing protein n=1 Tax=Physocladia obscura TaxID=109957 RepID=A0AAD5T1P4_9FUNG|nr:hypothetical protein HK100_012306 [Physocladia obscura]